MATALASVLAAAGLVVLTGEPGVRATGAGTDPRMGWRPASEGGPVAGYAGGSGVRGNSVVSAEGVPRADRRMARAAASRAPARRVRELTGRRGAQSKVFVLADGGLQQELSTVPVHYRAADGSWREIDTTVRRTGRSGFVFANESNTFRSFFGRDPGGLVRLETGGHAVTLGIDGGARPAAPRADGGSVTYAGALGGGVDLAYDVTPELLKERIVLARRPAGPGDVSFRFRMDAGDLRAVARPDGSIVFVSGEAGLPVLVMPKPFMVDSAPDSSSPYGTAWSGAVRQSVSGSGGRVTVTVTADGGWLADPARRYPVVIDPTLKIAPTPTDSQDTMILSDTPAANYDSSWRLSVGTTETGAARSLLKFPLAAAQTGIAPGTPIASAQLQLYYDQHHTVDPVVGVKAVTLQAHRATADWTELGATWNTASNNVGELSGTTEDVDDGDILQHSVVGTWPQATAADRSLGVNGDYVFNKNATTGESYTWNPIVPEAGNYRVEAHFVSGPDRTTAAPYTVNHSGGAASFTLNQSAASAAGVWRALGTTHPFAPGATANVVLRDVADSTKAVVADAIRITKDATAVRPAGDEASHWHSFSVRNTVQAWINNTVPNYGFVVKAADEAVLNLGGPRYEGSISSYNGETATYPRLVISYGRPGVAVNPPRTIRATGAELTWPAYAKTCGFFCGPGDELDEYQVHRSVRQTFTPSAATLVAPVPAGALAYADTTAVPTPADDDGLGNAYYYMVAVKTADGELIPGPTQLVRLPKAGRVTKIFQSGVVDTTLSSTRPDTNLDRIDGQAWLSVGNNSSVYGRTRAVVKFPVTGIPTTARVTLAEVKLWTAGTVGPDDGLWQMHPLTRDFTETQATWNRANSTTLWTTAGGDFTATATATVSPITNDPRRHNFAATALAQQWITTPTSNKGVLFNLGGTQATRAIFLSSEAEEPELGPQLVVTYLEATPESTYYVPDTPPAVAPGSTTTLPVTVTNTTTQTLSRNDWVLSYRWTRPDTTPVTAPQQQTPLPADLPSGSTVTLPAAAVTAPPASVEGSKRVEHHLQFDLFNKTTGKWLSTPGSVTGAVDSVGALKQSLAVEDSTSDQVGLEKFYSYTGKATGAGSTVMNNLHAGNAVWSYNAFTNPSRGLSTFVRLAYNSKDTSDTVAGFGWSLQASSIMRLGTPIDPHPNTHGRTVSLTDGDGTTHTFTLIDDKGTPSVLDDEYAHPAGVHLNLQRLADCKPKDEIDRAWVMTKPDRTAFYFDCAGYQSAIVDKNNNTMTLVYESRQSANQPTKFLRYITDATGRRTLTLDYYAKGEAYDFINDTTWTRASATNLTNPMIIDRVKRITDISGRQLTFTYTDKGLLGELIDGAGSAQPKTFKFAYDMTQGNKNVKLIRITDPRNNATQLAYYSPPVDDPKFNWSTRTITDRLGGLTTYTYTDPDGTTGQNVQTVVTDAENHPATYLLDGKGRPLQATNAKNQTTKLGWDTDNNVTRLEEPNGAVTTWAYHAKTGYPTLIKDAEVNANGWAGTVLGYQFGLNETTAELTSKLSSEGRLWTFTYTPTGNLATVTDPVGNTTPTAGDYTTSYTYDTTGQMLTARDANGRTTRFADYDPSGFPKTITDPLNRSTTFAYDIRGNVTEVTDARAKKTTQTYDTYGRPLENKVPKNQDTGEFIVTPAPVYDPNDNITRATAPNSAVSDAVYDAADQLIHQLMPKDNPTDPERRTSFTYDKVGNLRTQTEPKGTLSPTVGDYTTTYAYDEIYQLATVTNAAGHKITYSYDNVGNVSKVFDARRNTADPEDYSTWFWYDRNHRVRVEIDAAVKATVTDYDRDGLVKAVTDKAGAKTEILVDARGKPVEVKVPQVDNAGTITYRTTRYEYDQVGNPTKVITPRGVATAGVAEDFVHQTVYDELNRVKEQLTPYDPAHTRYNTPDRTIYSYDEVGRLTKVSAPPSSGQAVRNDTTYTYTDNGWMTSSTDPWGIETLYGYNPLGQQTVRIVAAAARTTSRWMTFDYFPDGKLKARTDHGVPVGNRVVLVDNSDFNNTKATGTWATSTSGTGYHGLNYRTHAAGTGTDTFEWQLNIPQDGSYDVAVWYPTGGTTTATYKVTHAGGTTDKPINQTAAAGTWVSLGKFSFTAGAPAKITLPQSATGVVVADAVRLIRDNAGETDDEFTTYSYGYDPNGNLTAVTDGSPNRRIDSYSVTYDGLNQVAKVDEIKAGLPPTTTSFTYDPNGMPETTTHAKNFARYVYDERNQVSSVSNGKSSTDPAPKVTTYTYTPRGERLHEVKANGNTVDYTYFLDGSLRTQVEKKPNGTLVSQHTMLYDLNGNRAVDAARKMNADNHAAYLDTTSTYTYDPRDRIDTLTKTGAGADTESYVHDANNNVIQATVKNVRTDYNYDRNRLLTSVTGGATVNYNYDPFGRLDTVTSGGLVLERKSYDGFDHVGEHRKTSGGVTAITRYTYDPFDRTATKTTNAGTASQKITTYNYLGLSTEVLEEVTGAVTKSYQYSPWGERLSQITRNADGTEEAAYYGYNPHTDVETLTDTTGDTKATYGYTAYGRDDEAQFTGVDKPDPVNPGKEPYNAYRYNAKRWDQGSGQYDMGFRDYSPNLNRFTSRDNYVGALADLNLTLNPFTGNRYAFGAGNPISNIELDGHIPDDCVRGNLRCGTDDEGTWHVEEVTGPPVIDYEADECIERCDSIRREAERRSTDCLDKGWGHWWGTLDSIAGNCNVWDKESDIIREMEERLNEQILNSPYDSQVLASMLAEQMLSQVEINRRVGLKGEELANINKNTERIYFNNGRYRVPDVLDHSRRIIGDVKNVRYQYYSSQLRDYVAWAQAQPEPYEVQLIVREGTRLSGQLQQAVDEGLITLVRILP